MINQSRARATRRRSAISKRRKHFDECIISKEMKIGNTSENQLAKG